MIKSLLTSFAAVVLVFAFGVMLAGAQTATTKPAQISVMPVSANIHGEPCALIKYGARVPSGFGAPYDLFATRGMLMDVFCKNEEAYVKLGNGLNTTYVYERGYEWDQADKKWNRVEWEGTQPVGSWFRADAYKTLKRTAKEMAKNNYVLAYTCQLVNSDWKCGCSDKACRTSTWQAQSFKYESVVPPTPGGLPPVVTIDLSMRNVVQDEPFGITYTNIGTEAVPYSPEPHCLVAFEYRENRRWVAYDPPYRIAAPCSQKRLGAGDEVEVKTTIPVGAPEGAWRVVFGVTDTKFYSDVFKVKAPNNTNSCVVAGCSSQVCVDEDTASRIITTCEYLPEYACYRNSVCERQADGECGWTEDDDLKMCLADPRVFFEKNTANQSAVRAYTDLLDSESAQ